MPGLKLFVALSNLVIPLAFYAVVRFSLTFCARTHLGASPAQRVVRTAVRSDVTTRRFQGKVFFLLCEFLTRAALAATRVGISSPRSCFIHDSIGKVEASPFDSVQAIASQLHRPSSTSACRRRVVVAVRECCAIEKNGVASCDQLTNVTSHLSHDYFWIAPCVDHMTSVESVNRIAKLYVRVLPVSQVDSKLSVLFSVHYIVCHQLRIFSLPKVSVIRSKHDVVIRSRSAQITAGHRCQANVQLV